MEVQATLEYRTLEQQQIGEQQQINSTRYKNQLHR